LFATYARNSRFKDGIIYVGPMGCRTGMYLLTRGLTHEQAIELVRESFKFISGYTEKIPGTSEAECGNCREHNLESAKLEAAAMIPVLENWKPEMLKYNC
ncbi:MAG: S-ribosylhomocysteine lyase, partial [Oscillospiraceae bacterium]